MDGRRYLEETHAAPRPAKKQRQQRPSYSCQECRRLKMKCDRRVPCSNCVRRHRAELCHGASIGEDPPRRATEAAHVEYTQQQHCDSTTQGLAPQTCSDQVRNNSVPVHHGFDNQRPLEHQQSQPQLQPLHLDASSQPQPHSQPSILAQTSQYNHDYGHGDFDKLEQLALLARAIEPTAASRLHSHNPGGLPSSEVPRESSTGVPSSTNPASQLINHSDQNGSYGTLMFSQGGRFKYLGPTAGSEWLKDSETREISASPAVTRAPSPEGSSPEVPPRHNLSKPGSAPLIAFPFASQARISTRDLLSHLPPREEAWTLAESYYRYCAWHHDVAPRAAFQKTFDRVYKIVDGGSLSPTLNTQEIALVYMIMSQGTLYNIEMAYNDSSAEDWLHLSELALVKGDFLATNTIPGLQTLNLMAHHHLELDKGRRGDNAWPLWGLVMRLIQAMGMHRDGTRWSLPDDVVEERRKVFWECNAADIFQAHCFSRPNAIDPDHCDTLFPTESPNSNGEKCYSRLRYELSQLSSKILNMAMKVRRPEYSSVTELDLKLSQFERGVPFSLRCRAAFLSMPSRYPQIKEAVKASPEPSRRSMKASFQQMNLELNISETIINLHRPYYAKALYEDIDDLVKSEYAPSYLAVIERCLIIIAIVSDIHSRFPAVSIRQWNIWYHVFGSALCLGTLVLRDPGNPLATLIVTQIDDSICLFTSLIQHGANTPRYHRNLQSLLKLRAQAASKISTASTAKKNGLQRDAVHHDQLENGVREDGDDGEDVELIGWRTRLIERAGQDRRTIRTISLATTPNSASGIADMPCQPQSRNYLEDAQSQLLITDPMFPSVTPGSTLSDNFLYNFWDSLLPDDTFRDICDDPNLFRV